MTAGALRLLNYSVRLFARASRRPRQQPSRRPRAGAVGVLEADERSSRRDRSRPRLAGRVEFQGALRYRRGVMVLSTSASRPNLQVICLVARAQRQVDAVSLIPSSPSVAWQVRLDWTEFAGTIRSLPARIASCAESGSFRAGVQNIAYVNVDATR